MTDAITRAGERYMQHLMQMIDYLRKHEPAPTVRRVLLSCQIQAGPAQAWTNRTYEIIRGTDNQWLVDFGAGPLEPRRDWSAVIGWFEKLSPRDIEMLEEG